MRQHLIVAHAVNALCNGRSGAPRISALPDGWLVSGPSGEKLLCRTVEGLWDFIIGRFSNGSLLGSLLEDQQVYADDPDNAGLPAAVARAGKTMILKHFAGESNYDRLAET